MRFPTAKRDGRTGAGGESWERNPEREREREKEKCYLFAGDNNAATAVTAFVSPSFLPYRQNTAGHRTHCENPRRKCRDKHIGLKIHRLTNPMFEEGSQFRCYLAIIFITVNHRSRAELEYRVTLVVEFLGLFT